LAPSFQFGLRLIFADGAQSELVSSFVGVHIGKTTVARCDRDLTAISIIDKARRW
jgi:hypothetical protein